MFTKREETNDDSKRTLHFSNKELEEIPGSQARPATTGRGGGPLPGASRRLSMLPNGTDSQESVTLMIKFPLSGAFSPETDPSLC